MAFHSRTTSAQAIVGVSASTAERTVTIFDMRIVCSSARSVAERPMAMLRRNYPIPVAPPWALSAISIDMKRGDHPL
jgi:hypothetical protein